MARSESGPRSCSFPKTARLLRRAEYLAVKASGRGFAEGPLAASWAPREGSSTRKQRGSPPGAVARVGMAVSSKVGDSVVRNRIKRRIREAVRHELDNLPPVDLVLVARGSSRAASVEQLRRWLRAAAERIRSGLSQ